MGDIDLDSMTEINNEKNGRGVPQLTIATNGLTISKSAYSIMSKPERIRVFFIQKQKMVALRASVEADSKSYSCYCGSGSPHIGSKTLGTKLIKSIIEGQWKINLPFYKEQDGYYIFGTIKEDDNE